MVETGACRTTVRRALTCLEQSGAITCVSHRDIRLSGKIPAAPPGGTAEVKSSVARWQSVADGIAADVTRGVYRRGVMIPPSKTLCHTYKTCNAVMKQALAALAERMVLEKCGRGFRVVAAKTARTRSSILFLSPETGPTLFTLPTLNAPEMWRSIERECEQRNLAIETCPIDRFIRTAHTFRNRAQPILGCVAWTVALRNGDLPGIAEAAGSLSIPLAILDEGGTGLDRLKDRRGNCSWYRMTTSEDPGYRLGMHLIHLGHTRLAYFCRGSKSSGEEPRLTGLKRALAGAGMDTPVAVFRSDRRTTFDEALGASRAFAHWTTEVLDFAGELSSDPEARNDYKIAMRFFWETQHLGIDMTEEFQRAAACPELTAWVCSSDSIALAAQRFCSQNEIDVPGRLSIAGIDNTTEAFGKSITSYDFNTPAVIAELFERLLAPPSRRPIRRPVTVVELPGMVMARSTTGPALSVQPRGVRDNSGS